MAWIRSSPDSILGVPCSRDPQGRDAAEPVVRQTLLLRAAEQLDVAAATEEGGVDADASSNGGGEIVHHQTRWVPAAKEGRCRRDAEGAVPSGIHLSSSPTQSLP